MKTLRLLLPMVSDPGEAGALLASWPDGCTCTIAINDAGGRYEVIWRECPAHPTGPDRGHGGDR